MICFVFIIHYKKIYDIKFRKLLEQRGYFETVRIYFPDFQE